MSAREAAVVFGFVAVVVIALALLASGTAAGWGMMGPGGVTGGLGMTPVGWLVMLVFWLPTIALFALGVLWLLRRDNAALAGGPSRDRSFEILRERYARGEISREEYERVRQDLENE